jgi:hypothetical protein
MTAITSAIAHKYTSGESHSDDYMKFKMLASSVFMDLVKSVFGTFGEYLEIMDVDLSSTRGTVKLKLIKSPDGFDAFCMAFALMKASGLPDENDIGEEVWWRQVHLLTIQMRQYREAKIILSNKLYFFNERLDAALSAGKHALMQKYMEQAEQQGLREVVRDKVAGRLGLFYSIFQDHLDLTATKLAMSGWDRGSHRVPMIAFYQFNEITMQMKDQPASHEDLYIAYCECLVRLTGIDPSQPIDIRQMNLKSISRYHAA